MIFNCYGKSPISSRLKKAGALLIFVFLVLHLTTIIALSFSESTDQKIRIRYEENLLSIRVNDADLKEVLFELANKTNIHIKLPIFINKKITFNKSGISLGEGLEYILKNLNHIILYSGIKNNKPMISRVFVFSWPKKSTMVTVNGTQAAISEIRADKSEIQAYKIKAYENQIEIMKKKLAKIPQNSRRAKHYSKRIKLLEKLIEKNKSRLNLTEHP